MRNRFIKNILLSALATSIWFALPASAQDLPASHRGSNPFLTWLHTDAKGKPLSLGFTASVQALTEFEKTASDSNPMPEMSLPLPRHPALPFRHLYFLWNPQGHEPPGIYDLPHYDVHFYLLSSSERNAISCMGEDEARCLKQPSQDAIPSHYGKTPAGVPKMGWHWVDLLSPEFNGQIFTSTMIYGYYDGHMAFLEPMVTKAFLQSHPQFSAPIRQPRIYPKAGYYPTVYRVRYLPLSDSYEFSLANFVFRR